MSTDHLVSDAAVEAAAPHIAVTALLDIIEGIGSTDQPRVIGIDRESAAVVRGYLRTCICEYDRETQP